MPQAPSLSVYIAGPDVFLPEAETLARRKKALCARHGLIGLHPLDQPDGAHGTGPEAARAIYAGNRAMMLAADAIIANLTPFRGPSADPGTVFEVGHMAGLGRPAFGYTLDPRPYADRVQPDDAAVEAFGLHDNLMIDCALTAFLVAPEHGSELERHLLAFERCLDAARRWFERCIAEGASPYARTRHP